MLIFVKSPSFLLPISYHTLFHAKTQYGKKNFKLLAILRQQLYILITFIFKNVHFFFKFSPNNVTWRGEYYGCEESYFCIIKIKATERPGKSKHSINYIRLQHKHNTNKNKIWISHDFEHPDRLILWVNIKTKDNIKLITWYDVTITKCDHC